MRTLLYVLLMTTTMMSCTAVAAERFAVVIGNNRGEVQELPLQYAHTDAQRMAEVLTQMGDFPAHNITVLQGNTDVEIRSALLHINERVRAAGPDAMLLVYYSGHADAEALHVQGSSFALTELVSLVRGSSASLRMLIVDACRAGVVTSRKGVQVRAPVALDVAGPIPDGFVVFAAASPGEDAQESDEVGASFFTHHLLSGLMGAADSDGDRLVSLEEAYRYAADHTLQASARSLAGPQHPSFRYDVGGQGRVVLTRLDAATAHGDVAFPPGPRWLMFNDRGQVIAEISGTSSQSLRVPAGRYVVVGRQTDALLEGSVDVQPNSTQVLLLDDMQRTDYARLVRKGGADVGFGVVGHAAVSLPLFANEDPCIGASAAGVAELRYVSVRLQYDACRSSFKNQTIQATTDQFSTTAVVTTALDISFMTLRAGGGVGGGFFSQHFVTRGIAPARQAPFGVGMIVVGAGANLPHGFVIDMQVEGRGYLLHTEPARSGFPIVPTFKLGVAKSF
jgi:hypothetical protein